METKISQQDDQLRSSPNGSVELMPEQPSAQSPVNKRNLLSWTLVIASILSSIFLFALDNTITANVTPRIIQSFGNSENLAWLSVAFLLGGVSVVLPFGQLYSMFDAQKLYCFSLILFCIGSALCGAAPSLDAFIVGRTIAGLGGTGIYLGAMTLLSVNTSEVERPIYLGLVGLVFGIGNVIGPVIGGAFANSSATWRWGFYINPCFIGLFGPVYLFLIPAFHPQSSRTVLDRVKNIDSLGAVLSISLLVSLLIAINFGGTQYAWDSARIIALFVLAFVLLILFSLQQMFTILTTKETRLFPITLLRRKEAVLLFILTGTFNAGGFIPIYYIPLYFQFTRGDGPLDSAVRLLPLIILISTFVMINGGMLSKGGYYMPWFLAGSSLILPGGAMLSQVDSQTNTAYVYGAEVLLGIGAGCGIQAGFAVIQAITESELMSASIGFIMVGQLLSVAIALSIAGAVFLNLGLNGLHTLLPEADRTELEGLLLGTSSQFLTTMADDQVQAVIDVILSALSRVFILTCVAGGVGMLCSTLLSRQKMRATAAM